MLGNHKILHRFYNLYSSYLKQFSCDYPAGTHCWLNIDSTLIQHHDVESTLSQCWINNVYLLWHDNTFERTICLSKFFLILRYMYFVRSAFNVGFFKLKGKSGILVDDFRFRTHKITKATVLWRHAKKGCGNIKSIFVENLAIIMDLMMRERFSLRRKLRSD